MKNSQFNTRRSLTQITSAFCLLLFALSTHGFGQESSVKDDVRVRYISSAPKARLVNSRNRIRYIKKAKSTPNTTVFKKLLPTDFAVEKKTFKLINEKRAEKGLAPLEWSDRAAQLARIHSQNMAKHDFFSHTGLNGRMVDQRAIDFGLNNWKSIGENIAFCKGFSNPANFVVKRWMLSDGHRRNLLNSMWRESAVGMAKTDEGKFFFTQIFIVE